MQSYPNVWEYENQWLLKPKYDQCILHRNSLLALARFQYWMLKKNPWRVQRTLYVMKLRLPHRGSDKMADVFHTAFKNVFDWLKMFEFRIQFHWSLFPRILLTIVQHWFRQWLATNQATSAYLNQWWLVYSRIYVSIGLNELRWIEPNSFSKTALISAQPKWL